MRVSHPHFLLLASVLLLAECKAAEEAYAEGRLDVLARPTSNEPLYLLQAPKNAESSTLKSYVALELLPGVADVGDLVRAGIVRAGDTVTIRGQFAEKTEEQLPALRVNSLERVRGGPVTDAHAMNNVRAPLRTRAASASANSEEDFVILFIPVAFCDKARAVSSEELRGIVLGTSDGSLADSGSVAGYLGFCSNGRRTLSLENAIIAEGVAIPCSGTNTYGSAWTTSRCTSMDLYGWAEAAVELAVGQLVGSRQSLRDRIQHVVLITPDGSSWKPRYDPSNCAAYIASGEVGRTRRLPGAAAGSAFGQVWVSGERRSVLNTYLHELSHNLGLYHAGTSESCQYCDRSCAMGACCWPRCHNAAHLWALGWAEPVEGGALALEDLAQGVALPYLLPAQHSAAASFVMVDVEPGNPNGTRIFLSYRRLRPPYEAFDPQLDNFVLVHRYLAGGSRTGSMDTVLVTKLAPPPPPPGSSAGGGGGGGGGGGAGKNGSSAAVWRDDATRLVVQAVAADGAAAVVTVCRAPLLQPSSRSGATAAAGDGSSGTAAVDWSACAQPQPDAAIALRALGMGTAQARPALPLVAPAAAAPPPATPPPRPRPEAQAAVAAPADAYAALQRKDSGTPQTRAQASPPVPAPSPPRPVPAPGSSPAGEAPRRGAGRRRGSGGDAPSPPVPAPSPPALPAPPSPAGAREETVPVGASGSSSSSSRRKRPPPPTLSSDGAAGARSVSSDTTPGPSPALLGGRGGRRRLRRSLQTLSS